MVGRSILGASALLAVAAAQNVNNNIPNADGLELVQEALQIGSTLDGTDALGASDEQVPSRVSQNNFINFCAGETLTNGLQITEGSCNGIPHGQIPAKNRMISSIIINPGPNDVIQSGQTFNIQVQMRNFEAGSFTNAFATYYSAPQFLNGDGVIVGHTHVTVQDLGSNIAPSQPPDPEQFAFFKGINDAGNGQLLLEAVVEGGLPPGNYRVCTLVSASNHQPVLMPVAQRGAQDDCNKFTVVGDDFDINDAANNGEGGIQAAADAQAAVDLGPGAIDPNADANADDAQAQDDQNAQGQDQNAQGQDQNAQGQDQNAQGQDQNAQGQDQNAQGQDQNAQGQDQNAQGQNNNNQAQGQDGQGQGNQAQGQDGQGQGNQAQGQDAQGQGNQAQGQGNQAQGQDAQGQGNQAQGQGNQAQGNQAQGQGNQAQGQGNQAQGQDAQGQGNQAQGQGNQAQGGNQAQSQDAQGQNNNQSAQGGSPSADQLRQQAESFFGNRGQNKRLVRFAKREFVA